MLTVAIRAVILYLVSILAMRLMGKRQVGQLQPYEFVMALLIADLAASPMENVETPLLYGIMPILALVCLHALLTMLDVRFPFMRRLLCASPSVIIRKGVIQHREMKRLNYTLSDLTEEVRSQGFLNLAHVETAILETSGKLSVFPKCAYDALTKKDVRMYADEELIPLTLILDGKVQKDHLALIGRTENWLENCLQKAGLDGVHHVFFAALDSEGKLFIQPMGDGEMSMHLPVINKREAKW